jgi:GNAT superfamily N-acetyltransferase
VIVAPENMASAWDDMQPLLREHYNEIAHDKHSIPLAPSRARYEALEHAGELFALGARIEGALIGYSVFFVKPHIHYATTLVAVNDVLFVAREYRNTLVGMRLISESEKKLRERGVVKLVWHIKPEHDWSAILARRGYMPVETIYGKLL